MPCGLQRVSQQEGAGGTRAVGEITSGKGEKVQKLMEDRGLGMGDGGEEQSLEMPSHAPGLPFIPQAQQSSFKLSYANSLYRAFASILHSMAGP
ncbi:hypothetical protein CB1_000824001 [Camelus ferus]|nr:hypothetical protein CB1_000824001 [Camelus ferus]